MPMSCGTKFELETIPRSRVYEVVAQQIREHILKDLAPGDTLPSERELVRMLGVSRSSVREAVHSLELTGLLEARQGIGTVVRDSSVDSLINPVANVLQKAKHIGELLDVRKMLEPPVAASAARNISPQQIEEMEKILRLQEEKLQHNEPAIEEDSSFHYAIAVAANNSVVMKLIDVLMDLLRGTREHTLQVEGRQEKSLAGHHLILATLKRGDAAAAEAAMRRHLAEVEYIVLNEIQKGWRLPHGSTICD
jgi:GntR family transcriptional regulator, transcriptional repressor for pyruvate dehydrogenase complex